MPYLGTGPIYGDLPVKTFTGDGSATTFALDHSVPSDSSIIVSIDGVRQHVASYNAAGGTTLDFLSVAPASGVSIEVVHLGIEASLNTPAALSVASGMIIDSAVTSAKIADGAIVDADINASAAIAAGKLASTLDLSSKTVTLPAASVTAHATDFDDNQLKEDIAMLGFKVEAASTLAKYNLKDQIIEGFNDRTGLVTGTNDTVASSKLTGQSPDNNYYGDSTDGALTTTGNVTHTVQNKVGSYDGDMVVKNYSTLTIAAGHTMTVDQPCRGMLIFVDGNCTINGTLSMDRRGALADPTASGGSDSNAVQSGGITLSFFTAVAGSQTLTQDGTNFNGCGTAARTAMANFTNASSDGTTCTVNRGGGGGASAASPNNDGNDGTDGASNANGANSGGGGSGGAASGSAVGGAGSSGTCFSGGSAGGGGNNGTGGAGTANGGAGGAGATNHNAGVGGGAGNPGGATATFGSGGQSMYQAQDGTGGLLILIVSGTLTIGTNGKITTAGGTGGGWTSGGNGYSCGGGGSGGGPMIIGHHGTLTDNGASGYGRITTGGVGGVGDSGGGSNSAAGGDGGDGSYQTFALAGESLGDFVASSTANTATTAPIKSDSIILYKDRVGTSALNTDIKLWVSRNGGTNWTEQTLVSSGTQGEFKLAAAHDSTISSTSGTDVRWKMQSYNQSVSKTIDIYGLSLGWS